MLLLSLLPSPMTAADVNSADAAPPASVAASAGNDDAELLDQLWSLWDVRRTEVATASIRYRDYSAHPSSELRLSIAEFRGVLSEYDLVARPDDLRDLLPRISDRVPAREPPWKLSQLTVQGSQVRWSAPPFDALIDGDQEYHFDADNQQVNVYPLGRSRRYIARLNDLRFIPWPGIDRSDYRAERMEGGRVRLSNATSDWMLDESTGITLWREVSLEPGAEPLREEWEQGIVEYPGGVPFPTVSLRAAYRDGYLASAWFRIVESAEFNVDLEPAAFQLATLGRVTVVDYRGEQKRVQAVPRPSPDLRADLRADAVRVRRPPEAPRSDRLRWLLAINGLVLLGGGVYLWTSGRPRREAPFQLEVHDGEEATIPKPQSRSG